MEYILPALKTYGVWGALFVFFGYLILGGELTFRFPRRRR